MVKNVAVIKQTIYPQFMLAPNETKKTCRGWGKSIKSISTSKYNGVEVWFSKTTVRSTISTKEHDLSSSHKYLFSHRGTPVYCKCVRLSCVGLGVVMQLVLVSCIFTAQRDREQCSVGK